MKRYRSIFGFITLSISSATLYAAGWKIPQQSAKSVALSGAYIANTKGAEAAYYNPANMGFDEKEEQLSISLSQIELSSIHYRDNRGALYDGDSKKERVYIPTIFYSSKPYNDFRYGISLTAPGGLSKRWENPYPKTFAQEFSLRILELNPTLSYAITENFSLGFGLRALYSDGVVKSEGTVGGNLLKRDMKGDSFSYGYNAALAYKPTLYTNLSLTYRSNIDLKQKGDANLLINGVSGYNGGASVSIPLPATLAIAYAHQFNNVTLELIYEKTYWSKYSTLDFEYSGTITNPLLKAVFDDPVAKNWKDSIAKRVGVTYQYSDPLKLMAGFATDESPAPNSSISFESPSSNSKIYSFGFQYIPDKKNSYTFGYLYNKKEDISILNNSVNGTFSNSDAQILSLSYSMRF